MTESIAVALITGVLAVLGSYVGNLAVSTKKAREDALRDAERETRQAVRLDNIEKKLDEHNGYAEKFGSISQDITAIKKDIEFLKERIKNGKSR